MAAIKRSKEQRERDLAIISRLVLHGKTQAEIAGQFGVTQQQICYDVKTLCERWQAQALEATEIVKSRAIAELRETMRTLWEAWERSCEKKRVNRTQRETADADSPPKTVRTKSVESRDGNPAFLDAWLRCFIKYCELANIDPAKKVIVGGDKNNPIVLTVEQLEKAKAETEAWRRGRFGVGISTNGNGEHTSSNGHAEPNRN